MKKIIIAFVMLGVYGVGYAQTNTFPSSGNVGIGTLSPVLKLQTWTPGFTGRVAGFYNDGYLAGHFGYVHIGGSHQQNHYGVEIGYMNEQSTPHVHNSAMVFRTSQQEGPELTERMRISSGGNVGIGTTTPSEMLSVNGKIRSHEVKVETSNWPDYVFEPAYKLPDLKNTELFIRENKHLPGIPSAKEAEKDGINLGEMNGKLLQKIEELTLFIIDQNKRLENLEAKLSELNR